MGVKPCRVASAGLRALGLLALFAVGAAGQTTVRSARLFADLAPDDGAAEVRMEYVLDVAGTGDLRFELLGFGSATAPGFWLGERRTGTPIFLQPEQGSMRATDFTLNLGAPAEGFELVLRYLVAEAVERDGDNVRVHVPVLSVASPPAEGAVFSAEILVPPAWRMAEGFPSGLRREGDGRWVGELPVVPAVVSLRGRSDGVWRPGVPLAIDVAAVLVLLLFGAIGWRHLSGVAGAAELRVQGSAGDANSTRADGGTD